MRFLLLTIILFSACSFVPDSDEDGFSPERLASYVRFLSLDSLEGRGLGGRGEVLTTAYLANQLAVLGVQAVGENGSYFQQVPLVGVETLSTSKLYLAGKSISLLDEYVGNSEQQMDHVKFEAELIFVGHGITAPEFDWDDYKDVDIRDKILLLFTNEPPSEDDSFFGGRALTYYGRWTFKYEEAARRGALGVLIVHTDETAGYSWDVVRNSWSGPQFYVKNQPDVHKLALAGWLHSGSALKLFQKSSATKDKSLDELVNMANSKDFKPMPLGISANGELQTSIEPLVSRNVVAMFPGSDPEAGKEAVLYSAHWDHLGKMEGDSVDGIYNGAVDNATGCAVLLGIARAFSNLPEKPDRSVMFAFVGAEESGLLGSAYYAENPLMATMPQTAVNLNYDGLYPFGDTNDFSMLGYERTTLEGVVAELAKKFDVSLSPDAHPEQGYYYRSDHFSFAKHGVPAFSLKTGADYIDRPAGWGEQKIDDYRANHYHQPSDEFQEDWNFSGIAKLARFGFELGRLVAEQQELPGWKPGDEFAAAREQ